ncbi:MAG: hypothetical protein ACYDCL_23800 [Myxococcales bacterium]
MNHIAISLFAVAALAACSCNSTGSTGGGSGSSSTGSSTTGAHGSSTSAGTSSSGGTTGGSGTGGSSTGGTGSSSGSTGGSTGAATSGSTGGGSGGSSSFLLVDNDGQSTDISLPLFKGWLNAAGIAYDTYVEPANSSDTADVDPSDPQLTGVNKIVYFTGDNYGTDAPPTVSAAQQTLLQAWLDEGGKTLVLFSPGMPADFGQNRWTTAETNPFLTQYCGFAADNENPDWFNGTTAVDLGYDQTAYETVSGGSAAAFTGKTWTVVNDNQQNPSVRYYTSAVQPATGVVTLATLPADPAAAGANAPTAVVTLATKVGAKGTSTVLYVGLSVENLSNLIPGQNVQCDFLNAVQTAAALGGTASNCGITVPTGTASSPTLLVDNDAEATDVSLPIFQAWLTGLGGAFTTYTEPTTIPYDLADVDPSAPGLAGLNSIIWVNGDNAGVDSPPTVSDPQQALLDAWLDEGGKLLVLFSPGIIADFGRGGWVSQPESNLFLSAYLGFQSDLDNPDVWSTTASQDAAVESGSSVVVTGAAGVPAFNSLQWTMVNNNQQNPHVNFSSAIADPLAANVDVLATLSVDPTDSHANAAEPVAIGHKRVGAAGTSTVVWVGFTLENLAGTIPGYNTQAQFLQALASYAAVP